MTTPLQIANEKSTSDATGDEDIESYSRRLVASGKLSHDGAAVAAAASGAALGATAGVSMGPIGAAVGALIGGTVGAIVGIGMEEAKQVEAERDAEHDSGEVPPDPAMSEPVPQRLPMPSLLETEDKV